MSILCGFFDEYFLVMSSNFMFFKFTFILSFIFALIT